MIDVMVKKSPTLVASPRERILAEAFDLFYRSGIRAVGVDLLIARADVAKATFYRHFPSKADLVVAYVHERHETWMAELEASVTARTTNARERLLAVFDVIGEQFADPGFRGSAVANAVAEAGHEFPGVLDAARAHADALRAYVFALAKAAGVRRAADVADAWVMLIEGAFVAAQRQGEGDRVAAARRARRVAARALAIAMG
jgi:AcrR family transcriptional regulator